MERALGEAEPAAERPCVTNPLPEGPGANSPASSTNRLKS